jgi:hypothetical protein
MSNEAWIIDACRTPRGIGKAGKGALSGIHPQQLGATVLRALAERNGIRTEDVDDIIWGTSSQRGQQSGDLGRMAALDAGYDVRSSAVTLDRFCGSGITAVNLAAASVMGVTATQLYILEAFGNGNGFTDDELIKYYGASFGMVHPASDSSIRSRRSELVDRGKLVDTGRTRPSAFGRASTVWDLAGRLF